MAVFLKLYFTRRSQLRLDLFFEGDVDQMLKVESKSNWSKIKINSDMSTFLIFSADNFAKLTFPAQVNSQIFVQFLRNITFFFYFVQFGRNIWSQKNFMNSLNEQKH